MNGFLLDRCSDLEHEDCFQVLDGTNRVKVEKGKRYYYTYPVVAPHVTYRKALSLMTGLSEEELEQMGEEFDKRHGISTQ